MRANSISDAAAGQGPWQRAAPWFLFMAAVLVSRPFRGFHHDSLLYAAQTLNRLGTEAISRDVVFTFGNQDSFTVFTIIYAPVVRTLGLTQANMLFWALALICWTAALYVLTRQLFSDRRKRLVAMTAAMLLMPRYGDGVLAYAEEFVTPRPFAEALGMLALTASLKRYHLQGALLVAAAGVLHPLTGLGIASVWIWFTVNSFKQYLALAVAGVLVLFGLASYGVAPFRWLLQVTDPDWQALLMSQTSLAFVTTWGVGGMSAQALPILSVVLVIWLGPGHHARAARAVLFVGVTLEVISAIGADLLGNRLITSLQLWRGLIWLTLVGNLLAVSVLALLPVGSLAQRLFGLALAISVIEHLADNVPRISAAAAVVAALAIFVEYRLHYNWRRWAQALLAVVATVIGLAALTLPLIKTLGSATRPPELDLLMRLVVAGLVVLALGTRVRPWLGGMAAATALAGSVIIVDNRTPWQKYIDSAEAPPADIQQLIAGRQVYWEDAIDLMWFKFREPQFFSCRQKAGGLFFRDQAFEVARRAKALGRLNVADFAPRPGGICLGKQDPAEDGPTDKAQFTETCSALPELDLIVMRTRLEGLYRESWSVPARDHIVKRDLPDYTAFYVYHCEDFRNGAG